MHGGQARAISEVGEDDAALRRFRSRQAGQFSHKKRIRQSVKSVPPHPLRFIAARDRQQSGHTRQVMVKSRVETCHLGQVRKSAMKRLSQQDLLRQMVRIECTELVQILNHFGGDPLRLAIFRPAMHYPMPALRSTRHGRRVSRSNPPERPPPPCSPAPILSA